MLRLMIANAGDEEARHSEHSAPLASSEAQAGQPDNSAIPFQHRDEAEAALAGGDGLVPGLSTASAGVVTDSGAAAPSTVEEQARSTFGQVRKAGDRR